MKTLFSIALGILAAIGGYVDIGDLVFNTTAGATFGYQLLWAIVLGVGGIIVYAEMCGRVAAVSNRAVFDVVRERLGFAVGLVTLVGAELVSLLTLAAEVGGIALALELLFGHSYQLFIAVAVLGLALVLWAMPFEWIERVFGYGGLCLLVLVPAVFKLHPDWGEVAKGFAPHLETGNVPLYLYYVVGLVGAGMTPYEVYFYSSGGVEEEWTPKDLTTNRLNAIVGYCLGGILSFALLICAGALFLPRGISPELLGSVALVVQSPLGPIGLILMLVGIAFAVSGAAIDTAFSGAYNIAQFFGWEWGKYRHNAGAPRFTIAWIVMLVLAFAIVITGVNPIQVTEFAVIFSVVALPATYLPILLVANDRAYMGQYRNQRLSNLLGIFYLGVIVLVALAAIPLMIITNMGTQ
ncbi:MAG TPA: Nramp family divalent metal transporter [Gaiellaceae bacterium]|nr:Nramp family divalent metal transporter [Gaiellaceae bacterium]